MAHQASATGEAGQIKLTSSLIENFRMSKIFNSNNQQRVKLMDFDASGQHLITASDNDALNLYDASAGTHRRVLYSRKYGVQLVRYTHSETAVLYGSTRVDNAIRYMSLHDNKYIRYFTGHKSR